MYVTDYLTGLIKSVQSPDLKMIGLDIETSGLDPQQEILLLIQLSLDNESYVINAGKSDHRMIKYVLELLQERQLPIIGHNIKFDLKFIYMAYGILFTKVYDTMLAENLIYAGIGSKYISLAKLVEKYLGMRLDKETRNEFIGKQDFEFTPEQLEYAERDSTVLIPIFKKQFDLLQKVHQWDTFFLESQLEPVVTSMEFIGISFDKDKWHELAIQSEASRKENEIMLKERLFDSFDKYAGVYENAYQAAMNICIPKTEFKKASKESFTAITTKDEIKSAVIPMINFGSYKQVGHILNCLGIQVKTTNAKELILHSNESDIINILLNYREFNKKENSFGDDFFKYINPSTNKIHTNYNQLGAATGRFSSDYPNLQNIIKDSRYRGCFVARPGFLFGCADYSNIELRIVAEVSKEPKMIEAFKNELDLHRYTASLLYEIAYDSVTPEQRAIGKGFNFATIYGTSYKGLAYNFNWPEDRAKEFLYKYFKNYEVLKFFILKFGNKCIEKGYSVTILGRKRFFSLPKSLQKNDDFRIVARARRQAVNHLPQGTSADMIKQAMVNMFYLNPFGYENFRVLLTVHDEIVCEYKEELKEKAEEFIGDCMRKAGERFLKIVPIRYSLKSERYWIKD
jgi:DNA polymerase I-like protein with 3'-5' exonuclease and polymerase domains